jgi:hypothetical protein
MAPINLRGDLAKLSDAELVDRLETAMANYEELRRKPTRFRLWYSRRGPIRHPWAYRLFSIAGLRGSGLSMYLGFGPFLSFDAYGEHLALCELKDVKDELEKRVQLRRANVQ